VETDTAQQERGKADEQHSKTDEEQELVQVCWCILLWLLNVH